MSSTNEEYVEGIYLNDGTLKKFKDADLTQKVEELNSNKVSLCALKSIDDITGAPNSISFGVFDSLGYVTINIAGWIFLQFKIDASKSMFVRGRYGGNGWSDFIYIK